VRDPEDCGDPGFRRGRIFEADGADEDRTLSRLRELRGDPIDSAIAAHHGRIVERTGDGALVEFRRAVDPVRCAIEALQALR
jgi:adenylate cyclase